MRNGMPSHLIVERGKVFCRKLKRKRSRYCPESSLLHLHTSASCYLLSYHISASMLNTVLAGKHKENGKM